jgi:hypothetical protein
MAFGGLVQLPKGRPDGRPVEDKIGKCAWVSRFDLRGHPMGQAWARLMPLLRSRLLGECIFISACHPAINTASLHL